jgi:hypothetical protein
VSSRAIATRSPRERANVGPHRLGCG